MILLVETWTVGCSLTGPSLYHGGIVRATVDVKRRREAVATLHRAGRTSVFFWAAQRWPTRLLTREHSTLPGSQPASPTTMEQQYRRDRSKRGDGHTIRAGLLPGASRRIAQRTLVVGFFGCVRAISR